jgi:hypothetical protein
MTNGLLLPVRSERHTKNLGLNGSRCPSLRLALPPRRLPLDGFKRQAATLRRPAIDECHELRQAVSGHPSERERGIGDRRRPVSLTH